MAFSENGVLPTAFSLEQFWHWFDKTKVRLNCSHLTVLFNRALFWTWSKWCVPVVFYSCWRTHIPLHGGCEATIPAFKQALNYGTWDLVIKVCCFQCFRKKVCNNGWATAAGSRHQQLQGTLYTWWWDSELSSVKGVLLEYKQSSMPLFRPIHDTYGERENTLAYCRCISNWSRPDYYGIRQSLGRSATENMQYEVVPKLRDALAQKPLGS